MGTIQITVALMAITLFTIAIVTFATNFASDNNAPIDISDDTDLTSLNTAAQTNSTYFTENASSEYQSIIESTIPTGAQTLQSAAPFTVTPSGTVDYPMWFVVASLSVFMLALITSTITGLIRLDWLVIIVVITLFSGIWLF